MGILSSLGMVWLSVERTSSTVELRCPAPKPLTDNARQSGRMGGDESPAWDPDTDPEFVQLNGQTYFTWAVLFLAFLTALIGLLPLDNRMNGWQLTAGLGVTYLLLSVAMAYCIERFVTIAGWSERWRSRTNRLHAHPEGRYALWERWALDGRGNPRKRMRWVYLFLVAWPQFIFALKYFFGS